MVTDEQLAAELKQGSEAALEELVTRYHKPIFGYVLRMNGDYHSSHDIVQDIFIKMCRGIRHYQPGLSFRAWLYSVACNTCKDYRKLAYTRKVVPGLAETEHCATGDLTPEEAVFRDYERECIISALGRLGDIHRETLILRYYEDLKLEEIAAILGIPTGTVKSRLAKGLANLKQILTERSFEA